MGDEVFLKIRGKLKAVPGEVLTIGHLAELVAPKGELNKVAEICVRQVEGTPSSVIIISVLELIDEIKKHYPDLSVQHIGKSEAIIEIVEASVIPKKPSIFIVGLVCLVLFIGSGMAIMNFHADVNMGQVHQEVYYLLTGTRVKYPLWLQIPYSFGLGLGMMIFFNTLFGKRLNQDPSPMKVKMFSYQQGINQYLIGKREQAEKERHERSTASADCTYDDRPMEEEEGD